MAEGYIELSNVKKSFGPKHVLNGVTLSMDGSTTRGVLEDFSIHWLRRMSASASPSAPGASSIAVLMRTLGSPPPA